jgi:uncharacterized integral membrane protein
MRKIGRIAIKVIRFTSWPLLVIMLTFIATGYAMSGHYGMGGLMEPNTAKAIHKALHWPLGVLLLAHALCGIFLVLRRWRWLK